MLFIDSLPSSSLSEFLEEDSLRLALALAQQLVHELPVRFRDRRGARRVQHLTILDLTLNIPKHGRVVAYRQQSHSPVPLKIELRSISKQ